MIVLFHIAKPASYIASVVNTTAADDDVNATTLTITHYEIALHK